jgi:single-stranded-DNA-specific exonuclease
MKDVKKTLAKRVELNETEEKSIIVIGNPKWRIGILGIIAAKIVEEYKKPVFVWGSDGNDAIKGSGRSFGGVNLVSLMSSLPEDSLIEFGGHKAACGFSVSHEKIHLLEDRLLQVLDNIPKEEVSENGEYIEAKIKIDDVIIENYNVIEKLAPYGIGNPKPIFLFEKLPILAVKEFGKEKNHLELSFKNTKGRIIKAIAFFKNRESYSNILKAGDQIDLTATFEKSTFAGRTELRLRIVNIK